MTKRKKINPKKTDAIADTRASEKTIAQSTLNLQYAFDRDVDFKSRVIRISEEIDSGVFDKVDAAMNNLERSSRKMITVKINSEGGSVYDALAIIGRLTSSKCKIVTEGYGKVMSAATLILACGDERKMSKYCWLMHHESGYDGGFQKLSDHKDLLTQIHRQELHWAEAMAEFTEKPKKYWMSTGVRKDKYFTANECLELGIVDKVF